MRLAVTVALVALIGCAEPASKKFAFQYHWAILGGNERVVHVHSREELHQGHIDSLRTVTGVMTAFLNNKYELRVERAPRFTWSELELPLTQALLAAKKPLLRKQEFEDATCYSGVGLGVGHCATTTCSSGSGVPRFD